MPFTGHWGARRAARHGRARRQKRSASRQLLELARKRKGAEEHGGGLDQAQRRGLGVLTGVAAYGSQGAVRAGCPCHELDTRHASCRQWYGRRGRQDGTA